MYKTGIILHTYIIRICEDKVNNVCEAVRYYSDECHRNAHEEIIVFRGGFG